MDLIAGESSKVLRKQGFRSLILMSVDMEPELSNEPDPFGADNGRLDNGLVYYVPQNSKSRMRTAIALAVKVGSVLEEEDQHVVAHIVEHLAFNATTRYMNHDIVKFLESIGAEYGPCQNAITTTDETIYELFVLVNKPESARGPTTKPYRFSGVSLDIVLQTAARVVQLQSTYTVG